MSAPEAELSIAWQRSIGGDPMRFDELMGRHREPHRHYHTATHVRWVIRHVDELAATEPVVHLDEVVAAAFYHDAVYDPRRGDNEHVSAELARRDLATMGWVEASTARVAAMIEATAHLAPAPTGRASVADDHDAAVDTAVLLDADLAVLGADPAAYSTYVSGVRHEYAHVDPPAWREGRGRVLTTFLEAESIFRTPTGRHRWEAPARANLTAELAALD